MKTAVTSAASSTINVRPTPASRERLSRRAFGSHFQPSSFVTLHKFLLLGLILIGSGLLSTLAFAQTNYGTVVGTVTDPSGAAVAGANVTLTNHGTAVTQETTSGSAGTYTFVNLNPGSYSVTVSGTGFKTVTFNATDVQIGGTTRVDAALAVGQASETMTVTSASSDLHTDTSSLDGVIEGRQVVESPLNGRNVMNLLDFVPGVNPGGGTQGSTTANGGSGNFQAGGQTQAIAYGNYQIGGGFSGQSLFFIDGMGQNITENNVNALVPTQDSVQEFRVSTNNVSAEFGGYGGGVVQMATKSGTNQIHGTVYEYLRNTSLDSNDWFSNHDKLGKSPLHQNQFGLNVGGPIWKNKAFFFFSWEHESLISRGPDQAVVPTTNELAGIFTGEQTIYDPTTGQPFPNNTIPTGDIDQTALKILQLETPNESKVIQTPQVTNFFGSAPIEGYQNQYNLRLDANPTAKDSLFFRYANWNPHNGDSDPFGNRTGAGPTGNTTKEALLGETHTLNPTTIVDFRLSYLENYNFQYPLSDGFNMSSISAAYGTIQSESENQEGLLPQLSIPGYDVGAEGSQLYWLNNVWAFNGSVSKIVGKHTIKAGGNWRSSMWRSFSNSGGLGLSSNSFFTASSPSDQSTGNALASFLLGIPSSTSISSQLTQHAYLHNYGFYVSDTYQATPKLTITAGLRWEQPGSYSEEHDINTILQLNTPVTILGLTSIANPVTGATVPLTGQLALVNSPQYNPRREDDQHWKLFSPRLGFAYRLNEKTVVRSGYGISYLPAEYTQDGPQLSPIARANTSVTNTAGQPLLATVANPLPNGINPPPGHSQAGVDALQGFGLWGRIPSQPYGYTQQWNLAVERQLDSKSTVAIAYAGAKGTHLIVASPYTASELSRNQLPDNYDSLGSALLNQVSNPFYGQASSFAPGSVLGSPTVAEGYLLLPHPQYPLGVLQQAPRVGDSTYEALQATFTRHFSHAGIVQAAYTWSKLISDTDNTSAFQDGQGGSAVVQDVYNLKAEKSLSEQDLANNLVVNYGVNLPIGHGEMYLSNLNGVANALIGGWHVDGITILRSGLPLALVAANNALSQFGGGTPPFNLGQGIIRPDYSPGCHKTLSGSPHSRYDEWFNTSCFTQPGDFSFGNESRVDSTLKSEGEINFDLSLNKSFDLTEGVKLKFTTEFFDLFNHAEFAEPNLNLASPSFGQVGHQINLPRTIQFALRVSF